MRGTTFHPTKYHMRDEPKMGGLYYFVLLLDDFKKPLITKCEFDKLDKSIRGGYEHGGCPHHVTRGVQRTHGMSNWGVLKAII